MKNCLSKVHYLLLALLVVAMTGCGANKNAGLIDSNPGSISAKMAWSAAKGSAKTLAAVPAGVAKVRFTITGVNIPAVRRDVDATSATASIPGVTPGTNLTVFAQAFDATGAPLFEGSVFNVAVVGGQTTDVGTIGMIPAPPVNSADAGCLGCHEITMDQITGRQIIASFKQSRHYQASGVGCNGCHGPSHNDLNPSASGKCFGCHGAVLNDVHFNNFTAAGKPAEYVASNYQKNCSACHEPHNPKEGVGKAERQAWAGSAHGDVNGVAWSDENFTSGTAACQRCHTATGFKAFLASDFKQFPTVSNFPASERTREVLACDACHVDASFKVRPAAPFTAQYTRNGVAPAFPDTGETNLCIACHSARENGVDAVTNFSNASFKNSHYLPAAALMYMSAGFTKFTSASAVIGSSTYGKTLSPDNVTVPGYGISGGVGSTHRKLGTAGIVGDHGITAGNLDKNGPCVTCHLNANTATGGPRAAHGHSLAIDANAYNQVCINCHTAEGTTAINAGNFLTAFVEPQKEAYQNSIKLAVYLLKKNYGIDYDPNAYPYFFKSGAAVKDWTLGTGNQTLGKKLMGACFNIQILTKDAAGFAHARTYTRRLTYDTVDFLDDGVINLSVGATATSTDVATNLKDASGNPLFTKGTQAFVYTTKLGDIYTGTSEAAAYLLGWSRSTGLWNAPERP